MHRRSTDDLARIAQAGGGFVLDVRDRSTDDLARIAAHAAEGKARIVMVRVSKYTTDDLARIAEAAKGCVVFEG